MNRKALNIKTNFNSKIGCLYFIHLDVAPRSGIRESDADQTVFVINTLDHSHPAVEYKLDDLSRCKLCEVTDTITRLSHGMTRQEYLRFVEEKKYQADTEMAIYYYKKFTP